MSRMRINRVWSVRTDTSCCSWCLSSLRLFHSVLLTLVLWMFLSLCLVPPRPLWPSLSDFHLCLSNLQHVPLSSPSVCHYFLNFSPFFSSAVKQLISSQQTITGLNVDNVIFIPSVSAKCFLCKLNYQVKRNKVYINTEQSMDHLRRRKSKQQPRHYISDFNCLLQGNEPLFCTLIMS